MSNQYGVRDAACPISTKDGGGGGAPRAPRPRPARGGGAPPAGASICAVLDAGTAAASSAERAEAYGAGWRYERSPKRTLGSLLKATLRARGETEGERQPRTAREPPVYGVRDAAWAII